MNFSDWDDSLKRILDELGQEEIDVPSLDGRLKQLQDAAEAAEPDGNWNGRLVVALQWRVYVLMTEFKGEQARPLAEQCFKLAQRDIEITTRTMIAASISLAQVKTAMGDKDSAREVLSKLISDFGPHLKPFFSLLENAIEDLQAD